MTKANVIEKYEALPESEERNIILTSLRAQVAQPGEWRHNAMGRFCSVCHGSFGNTPDTAFCPDCGADMRKRGIK